MSVSFKQINSSSRYIVYNKNVSSKQLFSFAKQGYVFEIQR